MNNPPKTPISRPGDDDYDANLDPLDLHRRLYESNKAFDILTICIVFLMLGIIVIVVDNFYTNHRLRVRMNALETNMKYNAQLESKHYFMHQRVIEILDEEDARQNQLSQR